MEFKIVKYDSTKIYTDAVVLPANTKLKAGGGVSEKIFKQAGKGKLKKACEEIGSCPVGMSTITPGFDFGTDYIIHSVTPKWVDGERNEYQLLSSAYMSALYAADQAGCKSVSFPLLSSGHNGFDMSFAYEVAKQSINSFIPSNSLKTVILVIYSDEACKTVQDHGDYIELTPAKLQQEGIDMVPRAKKKETPKVLNILMDKGKDVIADNLDVDAGIDMAINAAKNWLRDEDNQKMLMEKGKQIVGIAVKVMAKKI